MRRYWLNFCLMRKVKIEIRYSKDRVNIAETQERCRRIEKGYQKVNQKGLEC